MSAVAQRWTPLELVRWTSAYFGRHEIASPRLDAELLLAHALGVRRLDLYLRFEEPVPPAARERYRELVQRRALERVPVAYLTGAREFWSLPLAVTPATLIPRPDTETLVRAVLELQPRRIAEVGTGCGAVALALASELPGAELVAVDVSPEALAVAVANAERLGLAERIRFLPGDGVVGLEGPFDVVASNPPYVPSGELEKLPPEVQHEPRLALDGGPEGLDFIGGLIRTTPPLLARGGVLALEVGAGQSPVVLHRMREAGAGRAEARSDLAGVERVVLGWFPGPVG